MRNFMTQKDYDKEDQRDMVNAMCKRIKTVIDRDYQGNKKRVRVAKAKA